MDACGPGVTTFAPGDPVVVFPLLWCGTCPACEHGKYVQCHDYDYLGSRSDGAFAEYVVAPEQNLIPIPQGVTLEEAAMTEPAAVALHALRRVQTPIVGKNVAIFGAGPIGLMTAQWAKLMGAAEVFLFDIVTEKLHLAKQLGFENVFSSAAADPLERLNARTDGKGAHICIEAAGVPETYRNALEAAAHGGSVVFLGNPAGDVTLPAALISQLMRREVAIFGTWNSDYSAAGNDDDWRAVLQAMASGRLTLSPLITHRVPLMEGADMLAKMRDKTEFYAKVLIHPARQEA